MQSRRHLLSASLLSTNCIREQIRNQLERNPSAFTDLTLSRGDDDANVTSPILLTQTGRHQESNRHRVVFSATTFPFHDPSPHKTKDETELLGLRLDLCTRNGQFSKPYYVLFQKEKSKRPLQHQSYRLTIHRHTIPAFIPVDKLAQRYLPLPNSRKSYWENDLKHDLDPGNIDSTEIGDPHPQDFTAFVRHLRRELAAWHFRRDAISWLREQMGLLEDRVGGSVNSSITRGTSPLSSPSRSIRNFHNSTEIISLKPTSIEARYVRLEWADGRVGRFKISNSGLIERAVVIGDRGRDKKMEDVLTGGGRRVDALLERLRVANI